MANGIGDFAGVSVDRQTSLDKSGEESLRSWVLSAKRQGGIVVANTAQQINGALGALAMILKQEDSDNNVVELDLADKISQGGLNHKDLPNPDSFVTGPVLLVIKNLTAYRSRCNEADTVIFRGHIEQLRQTFEEKGVPLRIIIGSSSSDFLKDVQFFSKNNQGECFTDMRSYCDIGKKPTRGGVSLPISDILSEH